MASTLRMSVCNSSAMTAFSADMASASSMKSPKGASSSEPTGISRLTGSRLCSSRSLILSIGMPDSAASSSSVASRPRCWCISRLIRASLLTCSTRCTGRRMVRLWSAIPRVMAWRIHHVAYVENLNPFV
ncbi:Uncharacterised protein [Mycobacterium tuberculosis]|uniref:Uncharacterized protein n=1 Tax=Mycobacterium tuberculosis TaxID=1773 RepID=A0A0U0T2M3_MYCTX|nr:Uncharacterised protein [Mycobacterium tuberculosis]CNL73415.1 Uncharacterised protein [Mycobacterium tuberculosis]CNL94044.1 Uncharacterised protein [Mycobacterium tuberculosis]CNM25914.1 Uncharacterised protein [Mycobacterium tuberculosis]CNM60748.1 Uncharacterised protein [Mycobacterium tuberculosis]